MALRAFGILIMRQLGIESPGPSQSRNAGRSARMICCKRWTLHRSFAASSPDLFPKQITL